MSAFEHPFYNRDLLQCIFRACAEVGPKTACYMTSTHRLARVLYDDIPTAEILEYIAASKGVLIVRAGWDMTLACVRAGTLALAHVQSVYKDDTWLRAVISRDWCAVLQMSNPHEDDYMRALERWPHAYQQLPTCAKTARVNTCAVTRNGHLLEYVPVGMKTYELCKIAIEGNCSLMYVPQQLRTGEIYDIIAAQGHVWTLPLGKRTQSRVAKTIIHAVGVVVHWSIHNHFFGLLMKYKPHVAAWLIVFAECPGAYEHFRRDMYRVDAAEFWIAAVQSKVAELRHVPPRLKKLITGYVPAK